MKGKTKFGVLLVLALIALVAVSGLATALPSVEYVKINGDEYENGDTLVVEKGEALEIKVKLQAGNTSYTNLEVESDIIGYEYNDREEISDSTHTFDLDAGDTVYKTLEVTVPTKAEKDYYDLRIRVSGRTGSSQEVLLRLNIKGGRHVLEVKNIMLHPANSVEAGSYLLVNAKVVNRGEKTEDDVRVTARIPKLNLEDSYYIDEIEKDESETSEDLFLRIPACTKPGRYEVELTVDYDEEYESVTKTTQIEILDSEGLCGAETGTEEKSIISVGSQSQQIIKGTGGATYSLAITNPSNADKTYTISVSGLDSWGTFRVDPATTMLVKAGQTKPVFIFVSANDNAAEGQNSFVVNIASAQETAPVQFYANVMKGDNTSSVRKWAEIVLIALVVLLIILGLVVGFTRMKGREGKEEEEDLTGQTYY